MLCEEEHLAFKQYNWVDVQEFASVLFYNYSFELHWAEDAWNLLMFKAVVKEKNIVPRQLDEEELGDVYIWLMALYHLYYDFLCLCGYDTVYFDHDVGVSGYGTYRSCSVIEQLDHFDDGRQHASLYLWNDIMETVNELAVEGKLPRQKIYDIEEKCFLFEGDQYEMPYNSERENEPDSVAKKVLLKEIYRRRRQFERQVSRYFGDDVPRLARFLSGQHWIDEYSDYLIKKRLLEESAAHKVATIRSALSDADCGFTLDVDSEYEDEEDVRRELEEALRDLEDEYDVAELVGNSYYQDLHDWIACGMNPL